MKYHVLNAKKHRKDFEINIGEISPFDVGIPLIDCDDKTIQQVYYYRWHVYCKHIRKTPKGHVITEFFPSVPWAQKYNAITCPAGHQLYEGRWLYNDKYITDYIKYWFVDKEGNPRHYSFWAADAVYNVCTVWGDFSIAKEVYEALKENYEGWEKSHLMENGLFYQTDNYDGMEFSAGGSGNRPTINSYMYGDAKALSKIAQHLGKNDDVEFYNKKAEDIKEKVDSLLWNESAEFYETLAEDKDYQLADVREEIGYVPWYFCLPDEDKSVAWKFLMDENYFYAPYGPTTAEQNHPDFMKEFDHACLWNGPSWPFATSQTLTALANLLCNYSQTIITKGDYFSMLHLYANSQYDKNEAGQLVPYIDENLHPFTGEWLTRRLIQRKKNPNGGADRGKHYNHSTFCDLVISGLAGLRTREDNVLEINPLFTENDMDYFCADGVLYHGKYITILWDKTGERYGKGKGLHIYCDGNEVASSSVITKTQTTI